MQNQHRSHLLNTLHHLWRGINALGGLFIWCCATTMVGLIVCLFALFISAFVNPELSKATAKCIMSWSFWITVALCAIVTGYLAWNFDPEEDDQDEASPKH